MVAVPMTVLTQMEVTFAHAQTQNCHWPMIDILVKVKKAGELV